MKPDVDHALQFLVEDSCGNAVRMAHDAAGSPRGPVVDCRDAPTDTLSAQIATGLKVKDTRTTNPKTLTDAVDRFRTARFIRVNLYNEKASDPHGVLHRSPFWYRSQNVRHLTSTSRVSLDGRTRSE